MSGVCGGEALLPSRAPLGRGGERIGEWLAQLMGRGGGGGGGRRSATCSLCLRPVEALGRPLHGAVTEYDSSFMLPCDQSLETTCLLGSCAFSCLWNFDM